jgi:hypothetical protein
MAVDPADARLLESLARLAPARTYQAHVEALQRDGYSIGTQEEAYVVRDSVGRLLHPTYELEGVWSQATRVNLWRGPEGESIRRELNLRMGAELVQTGPRSCWEFRNGPGGGPLAPVLWFDAEGVDVSADVQDVARVYSTRLMEWPYA